MRFSTRHTNNYHNLQQKESQPHFHKVTDSAPQAPIFHKSSHPIIQTKLTIGQPNDKYEREADTVADKVVNRLSANSSEANNLPTPPVQKSGIQPRLSGRQAFSHPNIQAKCAECGEETLQEKTEVPSALQRKPIFDSEDDSRMPGVQTKLDQRPIVQAKCAKCAKEETEELTHVQSKSESKTPSPSPNLESRLNSSKGSGQSLPEETRSDMEGTIGSDFSKVRVHTDSSAVQMNKELGAQAFTHGSDVYFGAGKYDTGSSDGQRLLAHELVHTVQQGGADIQKQDMCTSEAKMSSEQGQDSSTDMCYAPVQNSSLSSPGKFASIPTNILAKVLPKAGIRIHGSPSPTDPEYEGRVGLAEDRYVQPQGSFVTIIGIGTSPHVGWSLITTVWGQTGWIETRYLYPLSPLPTESKPDKIVNTPKPSALDTFTKKLYYVQQGDNLEQLVRQFYPTYNYETGNDRRTIVHAFYILNESNPGVRLTGRYDKSFLKDKIADRNFAETRKIYKTIRLYYGHWIRFPNLYYIKKQRALGTVGVRAGWKNSTIAVGRGIQGFIEGVETGFVQAAIDMVVDLWGLIKGIFTGELFRKGYKLVKQFIALYDKEGIKGIWRVVSEFFIGMYKSFKSKWETPNPRQRWKFIGSIVGMILFEVAIAFLTGGAGNVAKWSGRFAKVFRKVPDLGGIVKAGSGKLKKLNRKQGKKIKSAKSKRDRKRLGHSEEEWAKFSTGRERSWKEVKADPELLKLEMDAIKSTPARKSSVTGYDLEIELANGHTYRRKKGNKGWCRFSTTPEGCGDIPVDDFVGWDPDLEEQWNRVLLSEPDGKQIAQDVKSDTPKEERMLHLYRQLQRTRDLYMGPTPDRRSKTGDKVIARMRKDKPPRIRGRKPNEEVWVRGPEGKKDWYPIKETDMGHYPEDAVRWWNREGFRSGAKSGKVKKWMKDPNNYELQHKEVNRRAGAKLAANGVKYRKPQT